MTRHTPIRGVKAPLAIAALAVLAVQTVAAAQTPDPYEQARRRRGALAANPELVITNVGVDSNVFNEVTDAKSDFTLTARPGTDFWVRAGRVRLAGHTHAAMNYFAQYDTERSVDWYNRARIEVRTLRVTPFANVGFVTARDRLTPEFDARVRRQERTAGVGADVALGAKTTARVSAQRYDTNYNDSFAAGAFSASLDHRETSVGLALRHRLTPLTTLVLEAERQQNAFDFATERDAASFRLMPGVEFAAGALIQGGAAVGYRQLDFDTPSVRDFSGLVAQIGLAYAPRPTLRLGFTSDRNLEYSFDIQQPYYVSSGIGMDVTQQFSPRWSGLARLARRRLNYKDAFPRPSERRIDGVTQLAVGVGYRLGLHTRAETLLAFNRRDSLRREREYAGVRFGSSLTYEF